MDQKRQQKTSGLENHPEVKQAFEAEVSRIIAFSDTIERLEHSLSTFLDRLSEGHRKNNLLDIGLAKQSYRLANGLFAYVKKHPPDENTPYILAAISYFANEKDASRDFIEIDGFEDDLLVLETVITNLNIKNQVRAEIEQIEKKGTESV